MECSPSTVASRTRSRSSAASPRRGAGGQSRRGRPQGRQLEAHCLRRLRNGRPVRCQVGKGRLGPSPPLRQSTTLAAVIRALLVLVTTLTLLASQASAAEVAPYRSSIDTLPAKVRAQLAGGFWRPGCPVPRWQLRLLTVSHWGFDGRAHAGQLIVNQDVAAPLAKVFRALYELRFPIRHLHPRRHVRAESASRPTRTSADRSSAGRRCRRRARAGTDGQLVEPRLRPRDRPQPAREPLRRLWPHTRPRPDAVPRPHAAAAREW